jgi:hypothetical protein
MTVYMSADTCMQLDFESWSKLKLRLKMEKFIKECVPVNWHLLTIFTDAVGRILTNSQIRPSCESYHAAAIEIQITFGPNGSLRQSPVCCIQQPHHNIRKLLYH